MSTKNDSLFSTWTRAAFRPDALYGGEKPERQRASPLVFALIVGALVSVATALTQVGLRGAVGALFVSPFKTIIAVYVSAALIHLWLIILRGRNGAFRDTTAAVCYAHAPLVFGVVPVPILGAVVGYVWYLAVLAIGLTYAQRTTAWRAWVATILGAGTPVLFALTVRGGIVEAFKVPSGAMMPTIMIGDHLFVEKLSYGPLIPFTDARLYAGLPPRRGEVMVFKFPENKEQDFIKRAIALPGDTLEAINGRPVIDGWIVPHCRVGPLRYEGRAAELFVEFLEDRDYLTLFDEDPDKVPCTDDASCGPGLACRGGICGALRGPFKVAPDEVWVMGDNRNNSHDSRSWRGGLGAGVPFENIKGRATIIWMSFGPGGGVMQDRLFVSMNGRPALPAMNSELEPSLAKCLRERPPVTATTPPRGRH